MLLPESNQIFQNIAPENTGFTHLNGLIFCDTGNEGHKFNRFAERGNVLYASMLGLTSVVTVESGKDARQILKAVTENNDALAAVHLVTGFELGLINPVFIATGAEDTRIDVRKTIAINADGNPLALERLAGSLDSLRLNQLSRVHARAMANLARYRGVFPGINVDEDEYRRLAESTFYLNQKQNYFNMVRENAELGLPRHVATYLADSANLPPIWERFVSEIAGPMEADINGRFIMKSALDAGGDVQAIFTEETYADAIQSIAEQNTAKEANPVRLDVECAIAGSEDFAGLPLLVQPFIENLPQGEIAEFPENYAINIQINPDGTPNIVLANRQLYRNEERTVYLGSYWSKELQANIIDAVGHQQLQNLLELIASTGYSGPLELEGMNNQGVSEFIYDCNVRLSAVMPLLAARAWLTSQGLTVDSMAHLGYNGIFKIEDFPSVLNTLRDQGALLTRESKSGIILLPDLNRKKRFVAMLVNISEDMIQPYFEQLKVLADETYLDAVY